MQPNKQHPLNAWQDQNTDLIDSPVGNQVSRMFAVLNAAQVTVGISNSWEARIAGESSKVPAVVDLVCAYGLARLLVHGWKEFPIEVPPSEEQEWRDAGVGVNFDEFYSINIAGAAGAFMEPAAKDDPGIVRDTVKHQLTKLYARLDKLTDKPLDWYTPDESFTPDQVSEGYAWDEYSRIFEGFELFEKLVCFQYAFPKLRDFAITETSEIFNIPSKELYEALLEIDLNELAGKIGEYEPVLRRIFRFLVAKDYINDVPDQPDIFWWYHPKHEMTAQRRKGNQGPRRKR